MAYTRKEYIPEERAAYNAQKQAEMDEMIRRIDEGVKAVFQSEKVQGISEIRFKVYRLFRTKHAPYKFTASRCNSCSGIRQVEAAWQTG
ncbi:MAG: hypothetical protein L6V87_01975 [Ruminococcus sp.]|nr:MAG: hypothetical protein L6V87_01975 [Ruminococcus sp.]